MVTGENKTDILIKDSLFDNDQISNYHLSVELSKKSISYCIVDKQKYRCLLLSSQSYDLKDLHLIFNNDDYLNKKFISKSISVVNFPNTLIPSKLYVEDDKKNLLSINHQIEDEELLSDKVKSDIVNLYAIPRGIYQTIKNIIPEASIRSHSSILINNCINLNQSKETMFLYVKDSVVHIVISKNKDLLFQNKFEFQTKEDLLFYVLFCIQEMNLSNEEINTLVYGIIAKEEFNILYQYIRNIKYGNKLKDISCSNEFNNIDGHCYNLLYRQFLCV